MEDDLKKIKNGRRPQKKMEDDPKNWKTTSKQNLKKRRQHQNKICSQFLLNLGQSFPGIGSAL